MVIKWVVVVVKEEDRICRRFLSSFVRKTFTPFQLKNGLHTTNLRECRAGGGPDSRPPPRTHCVPRYQHFTSGQYLWPLDIMFDQMAPSVTTSTFVTEISWTPCHTTHVSSSKSGPTQSSLVWDISVRTKVLLKSHFTSLFLPSLPPSLPLYSRLDWALNHL